VVHVPTREVEDARHASRSLTTLRGERTRYRNRIQGLLALHGARKLRIDARFPELGLNSDGVVRWVKRRHMPTSLAVIHSDPEILGGTPVFVGTRVPFRNLIDYLKRNHSLDEFLDAFPTVSREQAVAALEAAHEAVTARARSAR
jgi:uncharacterized protein (DUF433 family)